MSSDTSADASADASAEVLGTIIPQQLSIFESLKTFEVLVQQNPNVKSPGSKPEKVHPQIILSSMARSLEIAGVEAYLETNNEEKKEVECSQNIY